MPEVSMDRLIPDDSTTAGAREVSMDRLVPATQESEEEKYSAWQNVYLRARPYIKSTTEGLGLGGGAIVGAAAGPPGVVAGGALGYGMAVQGVEALDEVFGVGKTGTIPEELLESAKDVGAGAMLTMGGEVLGAGVGAAVKGAVKGVKYITPAVKEKTLAKTAGGILGRAETGEVASTIETNIAQAKELEKKIPGIKFTHGQITNDAGAIALERKLLRGSTKTQRRGFVVSGAELNQEQRAFAEKALADYYDSMLLKEGATEAVTDRLQTIKNSLDVNAKKAQQSVDAQVARMSRAIDDQEAGGVVRGRLKKIRQVEADKADVLYDRIPNVETDTAPAIEALNETLASFNSKTQLPSTFPGKIVALIKSALGVGEEIDMAAYEGYPDAVIEQIKQELANEGGRERTIDFKSLKELRSTILDDMRAAKSNEQRQLLRRLSMLERGITASMDTLADDPSEVGKLYRQASDFWSVFKTRFDEGPVADVLQAGGRGEEGRIALSNVAGKFFTKDGVDDFLQAVGDDQIAKDAMKDYARYSLLNKAHNAYTGKLNPTTAFNWITKNGKVLEKLGVKKELLEAAKTGKDLGISQAALDVFNKSVASKALQADVSDVVKNTFAGSRNYGATARQLMDLVKGDKAAEIGLKKAIAEHILESSKVTAEGFFTDFKVSNAGLTKQLKKYLPALRVLYKDEPDKLKAIMDVHKSYQILERTTKSPIGGGSDTAENLGNVLMGAAGARAGRFYLFKSVRDFFRKYSESRVNAYLLRATFDPDYAQSLMALVKNPAKIGHEAVKKHTATLLLYSYKQTRDEKPEPSQGWLRKGGWQKPQ